MRWGVEVGDVIIAEVFLLKNQEFIYSRVGQGDTLSEEERYGVGLLMRQLNVVNPNFAIAPSPSIPLPRGEREA